MKSIPLVLSQLGVRYSDCPTLPQQQQRLADCITVINAVASGIHRSPGTSPTTWPSVSMMDPRVEAQSLATDELLAMLASGDLATIHAHVDQVNLLRAELKFPFFVPPSDFELLCMAMTSAGQLARETQDAAASGGSPILLHPDQANAIIAAAANDTTAQTSVPGVAIGTIIPAPAGDTTPIGAVITDPSGGVWKRGASVTPWGTAAFYTRVG